MSAELSLSGTADDGSRWFEYFSDAFAELGQDPDGFYAISSLPTVGSAFGIDVDVFPNGNAFDLGKVTYDDQGLSGSGSESAPISDYTVDFDVNIADDDSIANSTDDNPGYETTLGSVQGSIGFTDGVVTSLELSSEITFTYRFGQDTFPYVGTFVFDGDRFELLVDDTALFGNLELRYAWQASGTIDQVLAPTVRGDYNGDGLVDADDYALWSAQFGDAGPDADGNRDGVVDAADYTIWRDSADRTAIAPIPEPTGLCVSLLAVFVYGSSAIRREHLLAT